jgi:Fe-S cluster biosynthesis and repair protein YggX
MRMIECVKLKTTAEGLDFPPLPGELGERIFQQVSKQAWKEWLTQQTILINEYRLNLMEEQAQQFLQEQMQQFFFAKKEHDSEKA